MAIDRPETNAGAPPLLGAAQHRKNFLVPRGMAALPAGEESCDDAVALKRSKRIAPFFGQIRPLKRPVGVVETWRLNGDGGNLEAHHDDQMSNTGPACRPASQAMRTPLSGLLDRHRPNRVRVMPRTLMPTTLRSYGPHLCLRLILCLPPPPPTSSMTTMEMIRVRFLSASTGHCGLGMLRAEAVGPVAAMPATSRKAFLP